MASGPVSDPLLSVSDLTVSIRGHNAVDGLSYSLNRGETLGVVGESGCGKTLAALTLLGLMPNHARVSGSVVFEGRELLTLSEHDFRQVRGDDIAMIFQEPMTALNPVMEIVDQVAEMFILHHGLTSRQAASAAIDALAQVHISDVERCACSYPHQLSGGQRQRVMIAIALACGPRLLIADEPTTALDVTVQAQILDLILEMQDQLGTAVLFISHNLGVISQIADRVMVMYAGRAVEIAPNDVLLHQPLHPYSRALLETLPKLGSRRTILPAIPGNVPPLGTQFDGCRFADRCSDALPTCREQIPELLLGPEEHSVACLRVADSQTHH